jgi:hypothetical protein
MKAIIDTGKFSGKHPFVALIINTEALESFLARDNNFKREIETGFAKIVEITPEQEQYIIKFDEDIEVLYNEITNEFFI